MNGTAPVTLAGFHTEVAVLYANTPAERAAARLRVAEHAHNNSDCAELLDMLGLLKDTQ